MLEGFILWAKFSHSALRQVGGALLGLNKMFFAESTKFGRVLVCHKR